MPALRETSACFCLFLLARKVRSFEHHSTRACELGRWWSLTIERFRGEISCCCYACCEWVSWNLCQWVSHSNSFSFWRKDFSFWKWKALKSFVDFFSLVIENLERFEVGGIFLVATMQGVCESHEVLRQWVTHTHTHTLSLSLVFSFLVV